MILTDLMEEMNNWPKFIEKILSDFRTTVYEISANSKINPSTISHIRTGKNKPSPKIIRDLEKALNIRIHNEDENNLWYERLEIDKLSNRQREIIDKINELDTTAPIVASWAGINPEYFYILLYKEKDIDDFIYEKIKHTLKKIEDFQAPGRTILSLNHVAEEHPVYITKMLDAEIKANVYKEEFQKINEEIVNIKLELKKKDAQIEELEAAVKVLGAKLGITGTLVQILEAVKSGRLS
jgi:hypothetical protein